MLYREVGAVAGQRVGRVREEIKKEASDIIRNKLKDPRVGFVTVTDVEVSGDLRHVKVFVSVYGDASEKQKTMEALHRAVGFVRTELGQRIRLRHTPEIQFSFDESIERGARIFELLGEVRAGRSADTTEDPDREKGDDVR